MKFQTTGAVSALAGAIALSTAGCAHVTPGKAINSSVAPAPAIPWTPPPEGRAAEAPEAKTLEIPEEYLKPGTTLSLAQLVDVGLRNNPRTREAWYFARAAAAEVGIQRAEFFPVIDLDGSITRQKTSAVGGQFTFLQTTYGPAASLNWLLFDFGGGRMADVAEAQAALYAADWAHNAAIQDVVLSIARAYYAYLNAKGLVVARESNLEESRRNLEAADERHRAGVATIADVLQAKTVVSRAELNLQEAQGRVEIIRGALATAVGVPANTPVDVGELPEDLPLDRVSESVEELIAKAMTERPDLAARRFVAEAAQKHIQSVRSEGLPKLFASGNMNRIYYYNTPGRGYSNNYSGSILLTVPVFRGFETVYSTRQAEEEAKLASASADLTADQVVLDVWTGYYGVRTAAQRVRTSRDLLQSATQSADVAQGRYKEGVGSILDLLTAQAQLADARSQEVEARSLWFLAMAELAYATGALLPRAAEITNPAAKEGGAP